MAKTQGEADYQESVRRSLASGIVPDDTVVDFGANPPFRRYTAADADRDADRVDDLHEAMRAGDGDAEARLRADLRADPPVHSSGSGERQLKAAEKAQARAARATPGGRSEAAGEGTA